MLQRFEKQGYLSTICGPLAIANLKQMTMWMDSLNKFHAKVMVKVYGRYANSEPKLFVNLAGEHPTFNKAFGRVRFAVE